MHRIYEGVRQGDGAIITDPYYHQLTRTFRGANSSMRCIWTGETLLSYLRRYNDPVVAAKVMESAEAIYATGCSIRRGGTAAELACQLSL